MMLAGIAMAGDYHMGATLICSDCHVMHYSLSHDFAGGNDTALGANGPHTYLLKAEPNDLCLMCHDGSPDEPDVLGDNTSSYVRLAGALTTGASPHEDWKGHTLGSTDVAPGGSWSHASVGLECIDCHHQHGSARGGKQIDGVTTITSAYRNLSTTAGGAPSGSVNVSYAIGTNDLTRDIFERDATIGQIGTHYTLSNIDYNEPISTKSAMAEFCKKCHADFHGAVGGAEIGGVAAGNGGEEFLRHPSAGVDVGAVGGGHSSISTLRGRTNIVKVMSPTGVWTTGAALPAEVSPTCTSCHKGHGNQNAFGLIHMSGTGTVGEEGDSDGTQAKNLCKQCHSQG